MYGIHLWKDSIIIMYEYIYIYYSAVFLLLDVPFLFVGMMHVNDKQMVRWTVSTKALPEIKSFLHVDEYMSHMSQNLPNSALGQWHITINWNTNNI